MKKCKPASKKNKISKRDKKIIISMLEGHTSLNVIPRNKAPEKYIHYKDKKGKEWSIIGTYNNLFDTYFYNFNEKDITDLFKRQGIKYKIKSRRYFIK